VRRRASQPDAGGRAAHGGPRVREQFVGADDRERRRVAPDQHARDVGLADDSRKLGRRGESRRCVSRSSTAWRAPWTGCSCRGLCVSGVSCHPPQRKQRSSRLSTRIASTWWRDIACRTRPRGVSSGTRRSSWRRGRRSRTWLERRFAGDPSAAWWRRRAAGDRPGAQAAGTASPAADDPRQSREDGGGILAPSDVRSAVRPAALPFECFRVARPARRRHRRRRSRHRATKSDYDRRYVRGISRSPIRCPSAGRAEQPEASLRVARAVTRRRLRVAMTPLRFRERPAAGEPDGLLVLHHGRVRRARSASASAKRSTRPAPARRHAAGAAVAARTARRHWYLVPRSGTPTGDVHAAYGEAGTVHDALWERTAIGPNARCSAVSRWAR